MAAIGGPLGQRWLANFMSRAGPQLARLLEGLGEYFCWVRAK